MPARHGFSRRPVPGLKQRAYTRPGTIHPIVSHLGKQDLCIVQQFLNFLRTHFCGIRIVHDLRCCTKQAYGTRRYNDVMAGGRSTAVDCLRYHAVREHDNRTFTQFQIHSSPDHCCHSSRPRPRRVENNIGFQRYLTCRTGNPDTTHTSVAHLHSDHLMAGENFASSAPNIISQKVDQPPGLYCGIRN